MFKNISVKVPLSAKYYAGALLTLGILVQQARKLFIKENIEEKRKSRLVVICGCDTELGLSMAKWAVDLGYHVLAGCFDPKGEGALWLKNYYFKGLGSLKVERLDVTDQKSINAFHKRAMEMLRQSDNFELHALVYNAAIAIGDENFWMRESRNLSAFEANFMGTLSLTARFQHQILEQNTSRLIIVVSEAVDRPFPCTSIFGDTKGALEDWVNSLRVELTEYGVTVVVFQPDTLLDQSPIASTNYEQQFDFERVGMTSESQQELVDFYEPDLDRMDQIFQTSFNPAPIQPLLDEEIEKEFSRALEEDDVRSSLIRNKFANLFQAARHFVNDRFPRCVSDFMRWTQ